jgi:hypothetical protein
LDNKSLLTTLSYRDYSVIMNQEKEQRVVTRAGVIAGGRPDNLRHVGGSREEMDDTGGTFNVMPPMCDPLTVDQASEHLEKLQRNPASSS